MKNIVNQLLRLAVVKDQIWYVKLPGAVGVSEVKVCDVTNKTVLLAIRGGFTKNWGYETRWVTTEVQWIEQT